MDTGFSLLVLAAVMFICLRRIAIVIAGFAYIVEKGLNRAAAMRGEPPVTSEEDALHF